LIEAGDYPRAMIQIKKLIDKGATMLYQFYAYLTHLVEPN
jgi:hypothetical protein